MRICKINSIDYNIIIHDLSVSSSQAYLTISYINYNKEIININIYSIFMLIQGNSLNNSCIFNKKYSYINIENDNFSIWNNSMNVDINIDKSKIEDVLAFNISNKSFVHKVFNNNITLKFEKTFDSCIKSLCWSPIKSFYS
jgi:hypothetical protein